MIKSILAAALIFIADFLFGQNQLLKRCPVKTINFEQGLANNTTTSAVTDALGYTWIAAKTGLQRYNGYSLETINPVVDKQIIKINSAVYLFALENGLILISYKEGVLEYNPQNNSFKKFIAFNSSNTNFSIIPVLQNNEGVWCLQSGKGLVLYSFYTGVLLKIISIGNTFTDNVFNKQDIVINTTFTAAGNSIFIYDGRNKIEQVDIKTNRINFITTNAIFCLAGAKDKLYTVSANLLTAFDINTKKTVQSTSLKSFYNENIFFACAYFFTNDQLLVSLNSRIFQFDTACNYKNEFTDINRSNILTFGFIRSIYADRFKRIWLLTNDNIKRVQNFDLPFEHLIYADKNNFIRSIYYDVQKNILLAGCYNGGIQLYDTSGNALWPTALLSNTVKDINGIEKLSGDDYLIVTISRGLYTLNLPSKTIKPILVLHANADTIDAGNINFTNNQQRINDSTILIITSSNVYSAVTGKENRFAFKALLPLNIGKTNLLNCFKYASNKTLYVGTATGKIFSIDSLQNIHQLQVPDNYLIRNISADAQQNIWVGTDKGLFIYNNQNRLIKIFNTQNGLLNDCIYAVLPVKNKAAVYASTNLGLSYVSLNENIINYTKESGLQENEFNTQSAVTAQGKYYFGGVNGITAFYPSSLFSVSDTPVLNITRLIINDSSYNSSPGYWKGDTIKLRYDQNHIQFDFAALGLLNTNEYVYKYRLKEFESNWQTTHEPTGIKYVLEPGNYTFSITCSPVFSSKSIFKRTVTIIVAPPFWQTLWFKILAALVCVTVIVLVVRQFLYSRYQKKLSALKLTQEIQHERERISSDLHDNLGAYAAAIASNISTIQNLNAGTNKEIFRQLKNNSQSIINQLNDTIWALNKESICLTAVSDRFKVFLQKIRPNYPHINIEIKESIAKDELLSPANALHLFRVMQETVNNALKHSGGNNIFIELISDKKWMVVIKDNGIGMPATDETVFGNGLNNIKTRSKTAGWNVQWISEPENGTEVIITSTTN